MKRPKFIWRALAVAALLAAAGCDGKPKLVPVTGMVKLDGKPVGGVRVYFWPKDPNPKLSVNQLAIGFSDKEGQFSLRGTNGEGIVAGDYKVTFARPMTRAGKATDKQNQKPEEVGAQESLSASLTDPELTKYTATVSEASNRFDFDLPSK